MVVAAYTSDLTDIFLFETTTGVSAWGGGASGLGASPDYAIQGTNAVDKQISAAEKGFMYDNTTNFAIGADDHFFIWVNLAVYGLADTRNNRGIQVCIGDDTSNFVKFHVNGSDTLPGGGIQPYAVRFANTTLTNRRTLVGTPGTTPSWIGCGANVTGTAKFSNLGADAARIGTGYDITGGTGADTEADFAGIEADDSSTAEGIIIPQGAGYALQGKLRIGNSGSPCEFLDSNVAISFTNNLDGHSLTDFTEILVSDNASILTLTNVTFTALGTNNPGRFEFLTPLITAQDETSYDNSPTTEGTFAGGTGHAVSDVITLSDGWTTVTVDAVSGGVVTQFTVDSTKGRTAVSGTALTQSSTTGSGTGFSLTPDADNIEGDATGTCAGIGFIDTGVTILGPNATFTGSRWIGCDQITANGATLTDSTVSGYEGTANTSVLIWDTNADPNGELDGMSFTKGTAATHAIELGQNSPLTVTLTDITFTGYNTTTNNQNDSTIHVKRTSGTVTINIAGNGTPGTNVTYRSDGATVVINSSPATVTVNVKDSAGANIQNARVLVETAATIASGEIFEAAVSSLTQSAGTATCTTSAAHGLETNDKVVIRGAQPDGYNKVATVTVSSTTVFTYSVASGLSSPATGTPVVSYAAIHGLTNASGDIAVTRPWGAAQQMKGWARKKNTSSPFYKDGDVSFTINTSAGNTINVVLQPDE